MRQRGQTGRAEPSCADGVRASSASGDPRPLDNTHLILELLARSRCGPADVVVARTRKACLLAPPPHAGARSARHEGWLDVSDFDAACRLTAATIPDSVRRSNSAISPTVTRPRLAG